MRRFIALLIALLAVTAFFALAPAARAAWVWPVSGDVITEYRNGTDPYATGQHRGIDISAPVGTPVVAAAGGDVRFSGTAGSSGLTIGIRTGDGYDTSYLHLSSLTVRAGAHVSAGERIGAVGTTGVRSAEAPHLHFGVRDAGTRHDYHDPLAFLPPPPPAPAPDPPPPAPATAPQPVPPAAAPVAAPQPQHAPQAAPGALGRPAPHGRAQRVPHHHPRPAPAGLPHPLNTPTPARSPRDVTARVTSAQHQRARGEPRHTAGQRPRASLDAPGHFSVATPGKPAGAAGQLPSPTHRRRQQAHGGLDIGWVAACAGLLLAAAFLGVAEEGRRSSGRIGSRLGRALPLLGRR